MYRLEFKFNQRPGPWRRVLAIVITAAVLTLAFFLGLIVLAVALGLVLIASIAMAIRRFRLRRQTDRQQPLEGQYTIIRRQKRP